MHVTIMTGDAQLELRMPRSLKQELEEAAGRRHQSLIEFATTALAEAARRVLVEQTEDQRQVNLTARDMERFLAMLDADTPPNAALSAAAEIHGQTAARRSGE